MVDCQLGSCAAYSTCFSTASSGISSTKSARQYHCSPAGKIGSNALCSAGSGIGCTPSSNRPGCDRASASASSAWSAGPVQHQTTAATFCRCSSSGNGGGGGPWGRGKGRRGGTLRKAKKPPSSSGASRMKSRYHLSRSAASSSDQNIGPATTVSIGCSLALILVTTPKLPPPPRIAQ